jgi:acyl-CoA synthetase (AMP-forming)/AMP-acid ligase II
VPLRETTIGEDLRRTAARVPDRPALVDVLSGRCWTYAELDADVDALARALLDAGLDKGDRVGIWSPNRPEWTLLQYAAARAGLVLVTVNPAYRTRYKVPRYVLFVDEFPMTVTGKVQKYRMRQATFERLGLQAGAATA